MPDIILKCARCGNSFVYSDYEQVQDQKLRRPQPKLDPICQSIEKQAEKHPPKPVK